MRDKGNHVERLQSRYKGMQGEKKKKVVQFLRFGPGERVIL